MGYFNFNKEKDTPGDLDSFLKERGYNFGAKELGLSLGWIEWICLKRKVISRKDIIEKELQYIKEIRSHYRKPIRKSLANFDPDLLLKAKFPSIQIKPPQNILDIDKKIAQLENTLYLSSLEKIKISPLYIVVLLWCSEIRKSRSSIDWILLENLLVWFKDNSKNSNLEALFPSSIYIKTIKKWFYKFKASYKENPKKASYYEGLIKFLYRKSFVNKENAINPIIHNKSNHLENWR